MTAVMWFIAFLVLFFMYGVTMEIDSVAHRWGLYGVSTGSARWRFSRWMASKSIWIVRLRSVLAMCAVIAFLCSAATTQRTESSALTVHLNTESGEVQTIKAINSQTDPLLVSDDSRYLIVRGSATEPFFVGGGLSRVCVQRPSGEKYCGFAGPSLNVKAGDEVFIRSAVFLLRTTHKKAECAPDALLITRNDAEKLAADGQFRIVD
jgi:hypothetical protein